MIKILFFSLLALLIIVTIIILYSVNKISSMTEDCVYCSNMNKCKNCPFKECGKK